VLVLEPSSCRVVKERVLRWFEPAPDCKQGLVVESGIPVVQVGNKFLQEQVGETLDIARHNMPTVPLSSLEVSRLQESVGPHLQLLVLLQQVQ